MCFRTATPQPPSLYAPLGLTTFAIAAEHFGTGLGTTVLFAALMTATRPADAGLHYTILTSANALALSQENLRFRSCQGQINRTSHPPRNQCPPEPVQQRLLQARGAIQTGFNGL